MRLRSVYAKDASLKCLVLFICFVLSCFGPSLPVVFADLLSVQLIEQEQTNWCWAGCSEMILDYYGENVSQCTMANYAAEQNDISVANCCVANPDDFPADCNQGNFVGSNPGSAQDILQLWAGVESSHIPNALSKTTIENEVSFGRPFIMEWVWIPAAALGHALVGRGIEGDNVYYIDPWPGNGYQIGAYESVVQSSIHRWERTLQLTTTPPKTLLGINISGPTQIQENTSAQFTATAFWSDDSSEQITPTWSENSPYASINSSGLLSADSVVSEQPLTVIASYTYNGRTETVSQQVVIIDSIVGRMMVSADLSFLALRSDGTILSWGVNYYGNIGDGSTEDRKHPIRVKLKDGTLLSNIQSILQYDNSFAITRGGNVYAWGKNHQDGGIMPFPLLVIDEAGQPIDNIKQISRSTMTASGTEQLSRDKLALTTSGTVSVLEPIIDGVPGLRFRSTVLTYEDGTEVNNVVKIATNGAQNYLLMNDGRVLAWGYNTSTIITGSNTGQLYDGTDIDREHPVAVLGIDGAPIDDAKGFDWSWHPKQTGSTIYSITKLMIVHNSGKVSILRHASFSLQDTNGNQINDAVSVRGGFDNFSVIRSGGIVQSWGYDNNGTLGLGSIEYVEYPTTVVFSGGTPISGIIDITRENGGSKCALKDNGYLFSWGEDELYPGNVRYADGAIVDLNAPIIDTIPPLIILAGDKTIQLCQGQAFEDPGAQAIDDYDGSLSTWISAISNVNTEISGSYSVRYNVSDTAGNQATEVVRTVIVGADGDNDGINECIEIAHNCLNANDSDTDDDGIQDGDEDKNHNGIIDSGETDPCNPDSDRDGIQDGTELGYIFNDISSDTNTNIFIPDADPSTSTNPLLADTDGDGFNDGQEDKNFNGRVDIGESDPNNISNKPFVNTLPAINLLLLE